MLEANICTASVKFEQNFSYSAQYIFNNPKPMSQLMKALAKKNSFHHYDSSLSHKKKKEILATIFENKIPSKVALKHPPSLRYYENYVFRNKRKNCAPKKKVNDEGEKQRRKEKILIRIVIGLEM